jgi:hypothetical protein
MATGHKRLSFRAKRTARQLRRSRNVNVQRTHLHELRHAISRKHGFRGPKKAPKPGAAGRYQRLSGNARHLIRRLLHSRDWSVQKQTVNELAREVDRGAQRAEAREARRARREERLERARQRGRQFRGWAQRRQEPALVRAERRHAERKAGTRKPALSDRARARVRSWRQRGTRPDPLRQPARTRPSRPVSAARPTPARNVMLRRPVRLRPARTSRTAPSRGRGGRAA